jgi:hypothetical protein
VEPTPTPCWISSVGATVTRRATDASWSGSCGPAAATAKPIPASHKSSSGTFSCELELRLDLAAPPRTTPHHHPPGSSGGRSATLSSPLSATRRSTDDARCWRARRADLARLTVSSAPATSGRRPPCRADPAPRVPDPAAVGACRVMACHGAAGSCPPAPGPALARGRRGAPLHAAADERLAQTAVELRCTLPSMSASRRPPRSTSRRGGGRGRRGRLDLDLGGETRERGDEKRDRRVARGRF